MCSEIQLLPALFAILFIGAICAFIVFAIVKMSFSGLDRSLQYLIVIIAVILMFALLGRTALDFILTGGERIVHIPQMAPPENWEPVSGPPPGTWITKEIHR